MKDYKIRQEIYHRLNKQFSDDLNHIDFKLTEDVVKEAVDYFFCTDKGWIYPSKSYMVAICYSRWLSENFGGNPLEYLNDSDLLHQNDPYFVTYVKDTNTYDEILGEIGGWNFCEKSGMVPDVKRYCIVDFMINE